MLEQDGPHQSFTSEMVMLLLGMLYCAMCTSMTYLSVLYVTRRVNDYKGLLGTPLPDLLFRWVNENFNYFKVTENILQILILMNVLLLVLHRRRITIIRRTFVILGTIYLLRVFTTIVTIFPVPNNPIFCPKEGFSQRGFWGLLQDIGPTFITFGMMNSGMISCGDSMFSGHAAVVILLSSNIAFSITSCILIPMSHQHYTMDVVFGVWISRHVFTLYYQIVFCQELYNAAFKSGDESSSVEEADPKHIAKPYENVIIAEDSDNYRVLTPSVFWHHLGTLYWGNPLFVFFEKNAVHYENEFKLPFSMSGINSFFDKISIFCKVHCFPCFGEPTSS